MGDGDNEENRQVDPPPASAGAGGADEPKSLEQIRRELENAMARRIFLIIFGAVLSIQAMVLMEFVIFEDDSGFFFLGRWLFQQLLFFELDTTVGMLCFAIVAHGAFLIADDFETVRLWKIVVRGAVVGGVMALIIHQLLNSSAEGSSDLAISIKKSAYFFESRFDVAVIDGGGRQLMINLAIWYLWLLVAFGIAGKAKAMAARVKAGEFLEGLVG